MSDSCLNLRETGDKPNCNDCAIENLALRATCYDILYAHYLLFGNQSYALTQKGCPNMTCCPECRIDDFCHIEGCKRAERVEKWLDY